MARRRGPPSSNSLTPQDSLTPSGSSSPALPRSVSPSSGFASFLAKPSKWFHRSSSASKVPTTTEPRSSVGSGRKHKISRPTDPRPILDRYVGGASQSVLDLSIRPPGTIESPFHPPSVPSSPTIQDSGELGDLRNISRRGWSKSADDLSKISPGSFSPVKPSFQEKVLEYRSRSGSSASARSPASSSPINGRHPFPSAVTTTPPSTSPPRSTTLPSLAISVSAPGSEDGTSPNSVTPTHVHTRSHSFTPKLPSKLSTPRFPPTPKRKGSGASEREPEDKELEKSPVQLPSRNLFGPGGASSPNAQANRATHLLAPPVILEPDQDDSVTIDSKRSSQIVFHSSFINRLADVPNFHHSTLSKGWKPYKLELKGSKMYFYKPPSDRAAGIKELFPTGLVPPSQEDELEGDTRIAEDWEGGLRTSRKSKDRGEGGSMGRKRRAFWGRRTHPDLIHGNNGQIGKGTFEALTHETVFATTFSRNTSEDQETPPTEPKQIRMEEWTEFASSIILSLPLLVGRNAFEAEFTRCCSYLISGADNSVKEAERSRVIWMAKEYLKYHAIPIDATAWKDWKNDTIPDVDIEPVPINMASGMSSAVSAHPFPVQDSLSPNFNTFSPRPEEADKMVSLMEALKEPNPVLSSPSRAKQSTELRIPETQHNLHPDSASVIWSPWNALKEEGLSREVLMFLDPHLISQSLTVFHRSIIDNINEPLTPELILGTETGGAQPTPISALFGSDDQPHWLTKFIILQILGSDTSGTPVNLQSSAFRKSDERTVAPTSRTYSRSEVISIWARVAELCRISGDEFSWKAISAALSSRPVARLERAWKRVDPQAIAAIEAWVNNDDQSEVKESRITPWGGDVKFRLNEELDKARGDSDSEMIQIPPLENAKRLFDEFHMIFSLCRPIRTGPEEPEMDEDVRKLIVYWQMVSTEGGGFGTLSSKFQRVENFMSLSLAAEPRRKGLFEPHFWTKSVTPHSHQTSLIPLLFPEALPTITLLDRAQLTRGRVDSDVSEVQLHRWFDAQMGVDERRALQRPNMMRDKTKQAILGSGGTVISVYNGDLLLVVQNSGLESTPSSRAPSRPTSSVMDSPTEKTLGRIPSIRVKPSSSHGLDRKTSVARRSSLPSVSQRQDFITSEPSSEPPLRVVIQAGTLSNLVNILVHGLRNISVSVADDNGEMSLREGMTRELVVDRAEFAKIWWTVFRSFVTPIVFFELLRKLYITAQPTHSSPPVSEYLSVTSFRNEVFETMKEWLTHGGGAQDILDDTQLHTAVKTFLDSPSDHMIYSSEGFQDPVVQQAWKSLMQVKQTLHTTFKSQIMRPTIPRGHHHQKPSTNGNEVRMRNVVSREPPDLDNMDPEAFVDNLDGMAFAAFSNVTEEDLYITADLLEVQSADRTGWFPVRDITSSDENIEVQTMYSQIQEVEPSSMISELGQDTLYRLLPPGVRSCIRAYSIVRKWLVSKIVAPRLGIRARQARMELLLQAIEVARLRNSETNGPGRSVDQPCVRSFVEAVTTSAILSVESRLHQRAWQGVALSRGCQCDALSTLLKRPYVQSVVSRESLAVDMGWLLERMLEIIASPDTIEPPSQDGQSLVNLEKRRQICNLIAKASSLPSARKFVQSDEAIRRGFERLNNVEKEVLYLQFDHRGIKEEASREAVYSTANGPASAKKIIRPFNRLITFQIEKNRRDKNLRSRMQKEKLHEQTKYERRDDLLNRAMRARKVPLVTQKQHRNKKSMSAFLNFMRPISTAFGSDSVHSNNLKKSAAELDFVPSGKPALVLSVMDARVVQFINNERSYTFQLDTEDGGHYLLQAMNRREMTKWLDTISRVTKMAAKRRLTYLGNSPKPQISDHIHDHPITASRDPKAVFGVELDFLLRREMGSNEIPPGTVPKIIEECLSEVESRGLTEVGIYRIAGATSEINALKEAYNKGDSPIQSTTDIHAVCDLVKSWFRVLPEPVFPPSSYYEIMSAMRIENLDERLRIIRNVVQALPQAHFDLLRRVSEHLDKVTDFEEHNHMTAEALAIVFSPNLLRAPQNDFAMILSNMGHTNKLVKALITHFHVIFDEVDQEAAHSSDDEELDSPILEEDEDEDEGEGELVEEEEESAGVGENDLTMRQHLPSSPKGFNLELSSL